VLAALYGHLSVLERLRCLGETLREEGPAGDGNPTTRGELAPSRRRRKLRRTDSSIPHMRLVLHHISYVRLTDGCKIFVLPSEACQAL
jgi:hypothetical protein